MSFRSLAVRCAGSSWRATRRFCLDFWNETPNTAAHDILVGGSMVFWIWAAYFAVGMLNFHFFHWW